VNRYRILEQFALQSSWSVHQCSVRSDTFKDFKPGQSPTFAGAAMFLRASGLDLGHAFLALMLIGSILLVGGLLFLVA
jgi:hypothetical protein